MDKEESRTLGLLAWGQTMTVPSHRVGKGGGKTKAGLLRWDGMGGEVLGLQ